MRKCNTMSINMCMHLTADQYMVCIQCVGVSAESLGMNVHSAVLQVLYLGVDNIRSIPVTYNMSFTTSYGTHHKNVTIIKN